MTSQADIQPGGDTDFVTFAQTLYVTVYTNEVAIIRPKKKKKHQRDNKSIGSGQFVPKVWNVLIKKELPGNFKNSNGPGKS